MKVLLIPIIFSLSQFVFSQIDTNRIDFLAVAPRNMVSVKPVLATSNLGDAALYIEYNRLNKATKRGNHNSNRSFYYALGLSLLGSNRVNFDQYSLVSVSDSSVVQRSMGTLSRNYDFNFGMEFQDRTLFVPTKFGGIQIYSRGYLIIGLLQNTEQYIYTTQFLGQIQDGNFENTIGDTQLNPIVGERLSEYLKIGFGSSFGFDIVAPYSDELAFSIGLTMGLFNLSGAFLVNSETTIDPDGVYSDPLKKIKAKSDLNWGLRFGILF